MDRKIKYTYYFKGYKYEDYMYVSDDCDDGDIEDWVMEEIKRDLDLGDWEFVEEYI